jgi:PhzF family phenazine biosynthesis protein
MARIPFFLVDSFTSMPFQGNPAGVVILERPAEPAWMQAVGMEMNQAETAFLHLIEGGYGLRWFTPTVEVDLCGHATLASAHILWQTGRLKPEQPARFHTRSGWLTCNRVGDEVEMDFPAKPVEPVESPHRLFQALGITAGQVFRNKMDYMIVLGSEQAVRELKPDHAAVAKTPCRGIIVTASARGSDYDFVSRFFAPQSGIPEDPVTGSAHCALGPYWAKVLEKNPLRGYQASQRGGFVTVTVRGDRVLLRGSAVTVVAGELTRTSKATDPGGAA